MRRKIAIVKAVGKIIWIQNDLLAKWHTVEGAEYAEQLYQEEQQEQQQQQKQQSDLSGNEEQEGCLHGNKVLGNDDDGQKSFSSPANIGTPLAAVKEDSASTHTTSTNGSGKTSLGRSIDEVDIKEMRCPFSGMAIEQRAEMTRPTLKSILDETSMGHVSQSQQQPSGIPKLRLVKGEMLGKEILEKEPWGQDVGSPVG